MTLDQNLDITEVTLPSNESYNDNEYSPTYDTEYFYQHIASLQNDVDDQSSNGVADNLTNLSFTMLHNVTYWQMCKRTRM